MSEPMDLDALDARLRIGNVRPSRDEGFALIARVRAAEAALQEVVRCPRCKLVMQTLVSEEDL